MVPILESTDAKALRRLLDRTPDDHGRIEPAVKDIIAAVRTRGDRALKEFARTFDKFDGHLELSPAEIHGGAADCPSHVRSAIRKAARHIRAVAKAQVPRPWTKQVAPGVKVSQRVVPLERVGCYVPGGRYPLPSSLLMAAVHGARRRRARGDRRLPAPRCRGARCRHRGRRGPRVPARRRPGHRGDGVRHGERAARRQDRRPGQRLGGAREGTRLARLRDRLLRRTERDRRRREDGNPQWIAADLLAQAEHDVDARAIFITPSRRLAQQVAQAIDAQLAGPDAEGTPARESLARNGAIVVTRTLEEAAALANRMAPEHLVVETAAVGAMIPVAGSIFVGEWTAQAAGDYAIGSNHVLPTSGAARFRGGLHAWDFVRVSSVQQLTRQGVALVGPTAATLADAEGLKLHAASIRARLGVPPHASDAPGRRVGTPRRGADCQVQAMSTSPTRTSTTAPTRRPTRCACT